MNPARLTLMTVLALLAAAPAASAKTYQVPLPPAFAGDFDRISRTSGIDALLPKSGPSPFRRVFSDWTAKRGSYVMNVGLARGCRGAGACYLGYFEAKAGVSARGPQRVRLFNGRIARYTPSRCGANCSAPIIEFTRDNARYRFGYKGLKSDRRGMIRLANEALRAGPR